MIFLSNFRLETFCKKNAPFSSLNVHVEYEVEGLGT